MVRISGKYQHERDENLVEYMEELGVSEELIKRSTQPGLTVEVSEEGNRHVYKTNIGLTFSYVLDDEFEEPTIQRIKASAKRKGDSIIVTSNIPDGRFAKRIFHFTDKGFTVVMILGRVSAKRHYKKI